MMTSVSHASTSSTYPGRGQASSLSKDAQASLFLNTLLQLRSSRSWVFLWASYQWDLPPEPPSRGVQVGM